MLRAGRAHSTGAVAPVEDAPTAMIKRSMDAVSPCAGIRHVGRPGLWRANVRHGSVWLVPAWPGIGYGSVLLTE